MINCYEYSRLTDRLYFGVGLTDAHLNNATEVIAKYLGNGGAAPLGDYLGIRILTRCDASGNLLYRRFVYGKDGKELTVREICGIGHFLPGGACYGRNGAPELERMS